MEEDYNKTLFYGFVWDELENKNDTVVRCFIKIMKEKTLDYQINGGNFPTVEFIMSMAEDQAKEQTKEQAIEQTIEHSSNEVEAPVESATVRRSVVRDSWVKKFDLK